MPKAIIAKNPPGRNRRTRVIAVSILGGVLIGIIATLLMRLAGGSFF